MLLYLEQSFKFLSLNLDGICLGNLFILGQCRELVKLAQPKLALYKNFPEDISRILDPKLVKPVQVFFRLQYCCENLELGLVYD